MSEGLGLVLVLGGVAGCAVERPETLPPDDADAVEEVGSVRWRLGLHGIGAVRPGMSLAEATTAVGVEADDPTPQAECRYVTFAVVPVGVSFMIVGDTVRRVDVRAGDVTTDRGARIGDPESRILELYADDLERMPHKYAPDGEYLVTSSPDSLSRLVFETEADTVTRMRVGLVPQVLWVEGCG
jgi:hypothetical protein